SLLLAAVFPWSAFFVSICIFGVLFLLWAEDKTIKHKEGFKWVAAATTLLLIMSFVVGESQDEVASAAHQEHAAVNPTSSQTPSTQKDGYTGGYKCADGNLHPEPCETLDEIINTISDRHHLDPDLLNSIIAE